MQTGQCIKGLQLNAAIISVNNLQQISVTYGAAEKEAALEKITKCILHSIG